MIRDDPELRPLADELEVELRDLRRPPAGLDCPTGANLEVDAPIVLTVGSDCAIGKMTVSLELDRAARARGIASDLRPHRADRDRDRGLGDRRRRRRLGLPRRRRRAPRRGGPRRGGELLFVEGQGSLVHPAYSGVTLGLFHGSVPHVLVLCHRAGTAEVEGSPGHPLPIAVRARRAPRAGVAPAPARPRGRDRREHCRARRRRGRRPRSRRPRKRRDCLPVIRSGKGRCCTRRSARSNELMRAA